MLPFLPKNQSPPLANLFVYPYRLLQVKKSVILVYFYNQQFVSIFGVQKIFSRSQFGQIDMLA